MRLFLIAGAIVAVLLGMWTITNSFTETPGADALPARPDVPVMTNPTGMPGAQAFTGLAMVAGGVMVFWLVLRRR